MKRRVYWLTYTIDEEWNEFIVEIWNREKKCVHRAVYTSYGMEEQCFDAQFYIAMSNPKQIAVQMYQNDLTEEQKHLIHKLFPYIPKFTTLKEFSFWHKRCQRTFSYKRYIGMQKTLCDIRAAEEHPADGKWRCAGFLEGNYLYCKWKDEAGKVHAVVMDDQIFVSDLTYNEVLLQEAVFIADEESQLDLFTETHREALLDVYVHGGGKRIFAFLTAPKMNHPMELLGKAGLGKLADRVEQFEGINHAGKNLNTIFGVPLMVLKSLEKGTCEMLYTAEEREILARAFAENRAVFADPMTEIGEMWLHYYYMCDQTIFALGESEKMPGNLAATIHYLNQMCEAGVNIYNVFGLYQNYINHAQSIGKLVEGIYPKNLEAAVQKEIHILRQRYDAMLVSKFQAVVGALEYQMYEEDLPGQPYKICAPGKAQDLLEAGEALHNCLGGYAGKIKNGTSKIYFIYARKNMAKDELTGAVEIQKDQLCQALGVCNRSLPKETWEYLKDYMQRKQLKDHALCRGW